MERIRETLYSFYEIKDNKKAFQYIQECVAKGYPMHYELGHHHMHGLGVPKDVSKAVAYFEQGCADKDSKCALHLGYYYQDIKDYKKAYGYFKLSFTLGHEPAEEHMNRTDALHKGLLQYSPMHNDYIKT